MLNERHGIRKWNYTQHGEMPDPGETGGTRSLSVGAILNCPSPIQLRACSPLRTRIPPLPCPCVGGGEQGEGGWEDKGGVYQVLFYLA